MMMYRVEWISRKMRGVGPRLWAPVLSCALALPAVGQETVSFCDYWPLAAGNEWLADEIDEYTLIEITGKKHVQGFDVWKKATTRTCWGIPATEVEYVVFVEGWLYATPSLEDLEQLPLVRGQMLATYPQDFVLGVPINLPGVVTPVVPTLGSLSDLLTGSHLTVDDFSCGDLPDCLGLMFEEGGSAYEILGRGVGLLARYIPSCPFVPEIIGGCEYEAPGEFEFVETPSGGWREAGQPFSLDVGVEDTVGTVYYQWKKDGEPIPDATDPVLYFASPTVEDTGWYSCRVLDDSKGALETEPVYVAVFAEGSLPGAGLGALAACAGVCLVAGVRRLRRRR